MAPADLRDSLRAAVASLGGGGESVVVAGADDLAIIAVNPAAQELLGDADWAGHTLEWLFPDVGAGELRTRIEALTRHGGKSMGITARPRWESEGGANVPVRLDVVRRDEVPLVVVFIRDSPEERALRPTTDAISPLAELPDRASLLAELDIEVRRAFRHRRGLAIVHVRLRMAGVPEAEQEALVLDAARRLRESVRGEETLGRSGPDGFAWILHEATAQGARTAAERARRVAQGPRSGAAAVSVGVAALVRGDGAADLLRRAELDTQVDPGPSRRAGRGASGLNAEAERLLRAAIGGDARSVVEIVRACMDERGHVAAYDEVLHPVMRRLVRGGASEPVRPPEEHRAAALLEWAVMRRHRVYPQPDAPVAVVMPMGVEARRVAAAAAADGAARAGWAPITLEVPPASDVTTPIAGLEGGAVILVLGDDSDLLEVAHIIEDAREALPGVQLLVFGTPGGILRRWTPPPPARAVPTTAGLVAALEGAGRGTASGGGGRAERRR
ncbi:MAG: diguanylate cyclase [Thermoleophilia bacterium]